MTTRNQSKGLISIASQIHVKASRYKKKPPLINATVGTASYNYATVLKTKSSISGKN